MALELLDETRHFNNWQIGLRKDTAAGELREALNELQGALRGAPSVFNSDVDSRTLKALKFSDLLPPEFALAVVAGRGSEPEHAEKVAARPVRSSRA